MSCDFQLELDLNAFKSNPVRIVLSGTRAIRMQFELNYWRHSNRTRIKIESIVWSDVSFAVIMSYFGGGTVLSKWFTQSYPSDTAVVGSQS